MATIMYLASLRNANSTQILAFALGSFSLAFFTWAIYILYLHPLAKISGPKSWILSRLPYVLALHTGTFAVRAKRLHERYGSVVRIGTNEVSFIDEKAWTAVYAYNQGPQFPKSPLWYRSRPNGAYGIMGSPNVDHSRFRRTFAPAFTDKAIRDQEPLILRHTENLKNRLEKEASNEIPIDIISRFEYTAFDIVGDFAYSQSFDCVKDVENHNQFVTVQTDMKGFTQAVVPRILGLEPIWHLVGPRLSRTGFFKNLNDWTHQRLSEGEVSGKNDLMKYAGLRTDGKGLSLPETENAIGDMMVAGSETVASTLAAVFYHLVRSPQIMHALKNEIRETFTNETDINMDNVAGLPLLNAVISEAMRLCPSLPMVLPRIVPDPGASVCGYWLPAGTFVTFCQLAAYSSPKNFHLPEKFIPSRWLPNSTMEPHCAGVFQPFSVGQRNCMGKGFGLAEVRLITAKLLRNFDFTKGERDWDWNTQKTYFVWEKRPLFVKVSPASR